MNPIFVKTWTKGLVTKIEDKDQARGSASECLNWHFLGDHIELRRGQKLLGTEVLGTGKVTGLRVARRHDGYQVPFYTYARKCLYYDQDTDATYEVGTDMFPATVLDDEGNAEDIAIEDYNSLSGNMVYLSSPNSSMYKIPVANPSNSVDLLAKEYRGKFRIKQSRTFLWDRKDTFGGSDLTGVHLSYIDQTELSYSFTSAEDLGTGNGLTTDFSGTLAFKANNSKETCFFVVIAGAKTAGTSISAITVDTSALVTSSSHGLSVGDTVVFSGVSGMTEINKRIGVVLTVPSSSTFTVNIDSTDFTAYSSGGTVAKAERFVDDRSGNLIGQDGGTGTINYATGAYSVTFNTAVISSQPVVAQYFREDSTVQGIADFDFDVPRTIGQGATFRQDDGGGKFMNIESLGAVEYCLHEFKTWALTIGSPDDTQGTSNLIYREDVGIPFHRASVATGDGIYYVDANSENPAIRILEYGRYQVNVQPRSVSDALDLSAYEFDRAVMFQWGDYICMACRTEDSTNNNRLFIRHRVWKSWEVHSFRVSVLEILNNALICGDSGSSNLFKLFSGLTDEESAIDNVFITNDDWLDKSGIKTVNRMKVAGYIGIDQSLEISYSVGHQPFVLATTIEGDGSYVNLSERKLIGNLTLGEEQIGGGQDPEDAIYASPYNYEFLVGTPRFERIRLKFEAKEIGYVSVSEYGFVDIRDKGMKLPPQNIQST